MSVYELMGRVPYLIPSGPVCPNLDQLIVELFRLFVAKFAVKLCRIDHQVGFQRHVGIPCGLESLWVRGEYKRRMRQEESMMLVKYISQSELPKVCLHACGMEVYLSQDKGGVGGWIGSVASSNGGVLRTIRPRCYISKSCAPKHAPLI